MFKRVIFFEQTIHEDLKNYKCNLSNEKEIVKKHGVLTYGIDHVMFHEKYIFCFQDKWRETKSGLSDINHFLTAVSNFVVFYNGIIIVFYLTKIPISSFGMCSFNNSKNNNCIYDYHCINSNDVDIILSNLHYILHSKYHCFKYDYDSSVIMLES